MSAGTPADKRLKDAIRLPIPLTGQDYQKFLEDLKRNLGLADVVDIAVVDQAFTDVGTTVYLRFSRDVPLRGKELGEADGLVIISGGTLSLAFDRKGELSSYLIDENVQETIAEGKHGLIKELQSGRVYFARPDQKVDTRALTAQGKRFYVQVDKEGKKRLHRVYL